MVWPGPCGCWATQSTCQDVISPTCLLSSFIPSFCQPVYCHRQPIYLANSSLAEFPALLSRVAVGPVPTCHGVAGAWRLLDNAVNLSRRHPVMLSTVIVYNVIMSTRLSTVIEGAGHWFFVLSCLHVPAPSQLGAGHWLSCSFMPACACTVSTRSGALVFMCLHACMCLPQATVTVSTHLSACLAPVSCSQNEATHCALMACPILSILLLIAGGHQGAIHSANSCQALWRAVAGTPGYFSYSHITRQDRMAMTQALRSIGLLSCARRVVKAQDAACG
jgi:hypothetical protein